MAYRLGERKQMNLFPQSIEEYVSQDDPVRAYDTFVEVLNFKDLRIKIDDNKVGNSSYNPKVMMKLLVYSYSYGWRSSRKIERATHHNMSFIWLMGELKPDHKTISRFRRDNKSALKQVLKQCARMCMKLNLIDGNVLFADGTKIRANASRNKNYTKEQYNKKLTVIEERITKLLDECEDIDNQEKHSDSLVKMDKELTRQHNLKNKMQRLLQEFNADDKTTKTINTTDPESRIMKSVQGSHASYNVQSIVDDKNGLIVHAEATDSPTDNKQLSKQIESAQKTTEKQCDTACADAGYSDVDDLAKLDTKEIKVIVPNQKQVSIKQPGSFSKEKFRYDEKSDQYKCPQGHWLRKSSYDKRKNQYIYRITSKKICKSCPHYRKCTQDKKGRTIHRLANEKLKEKLASQYNEEESQAIYARRKTRIEHPFGHIKRNLGINNFLLRGCEGAKTEISIAATCFNIARMITLFGSVQNMIANISVVNG